MISRFCEFYLTISFCHLEDNCRQRVAHLSTTTTGLHRGFTAHQNLQCPPPPPWDEGKRKGDQNRTEIAEVYPPKPHLAVLSAKESTERGEGVPEGGGSHSTIVCVCVYEEELSKRWEYGVGRKGHVVDTRRSNVLDSIPFAEMVPKSLFFCIFFSVVEGKYPPYFMFPFI